MTYYISQSAASLRTTLATDLTPGGLGNILYPVLGTEFGVTQPQYPYYNVLRYGADPLGIADSTAAFQAALNSVSYIVSPTTLAQCLAQGGEVFVPRGVYVITSTLYLNSNVHLVGEDCGPLEQSPLSTMPPLGTAMLYYKSLTTQSICVDATGFWLTTQNAYTGTASAGGASTITITTGLTIAVNAGTLITITGGTAAGQVRPIAGYISGTGVATVGWPWSTIPDNTSVWSIGGHANGSRISQLITPGELAIEANGVGSLVQAPLVKNLSIVSTTAHYMGIRLAVAPNGEVENCLITGFQVSLEVTGSSYSGFKNIVSAALYIGFGWIISDHISRTRCCDFSVQGSAGPITVGNAPWFVSWMANEGLDPNSNYWTAHYDAITGIGTYDCCDGEGGDRSYFFAQPFGTVMTGCHMERFTHVGVYQNSGSLIVLGGDYYSANTAPAFAGNSAHLTIDSFQPDTSNGAGSLTIGSFTGASKVTVRNVTPAGGDSAPGLGSQVLWDNYDQNFLSIGTLNTVGAGVLTATALYGGGGNGAVIRGGAQVGAFSDTTDTAANMIAAFTTAAINVVTSIPTIGSSFNCTIYNSTTQIQTLLPGSGVTFSGPLASSATIAAGANRTVKISVSNVITPAVSILG
jgi:hypothetical protein